LLDSYGNEIALTTSFNVAKNGSVMFDYLLQQGIDITDIVVYINGIPYKVSVKNGVVYAEIIPTPVPPNPTSTPIADAPLKQTYTTATPSCYRPSYWPSYMPCMPS
jgi:hypothetical protein